MNKVSKCAECSSGKNVKACDYCGRFFCSDHKAPRIPFIGHYAEIMDRDETPNSHPCFGYAKFKEEEKNKKDEEYGEALNKMLSSKKNWISEVDTTYVKPTNKRSSYAFESKPKKNYLKEDSYVEMYQPNKKNKEHYHSSHNFSFSLDFLKFHIPHEIKSSFFGLLIAVAIGLLFNYIYYQSLSLEMLFIWGVKEWFLILQQTLSYGVVVTYNLFYLIINGLFYFYLYSNVIGFIIAVIQNLDRKDTWKMIGWIVVLTFAISRWILPLL